MPDYLFHRNLNRAAYQPYASPAADEPEPVGRSQMPGMVQKFARAALVAYLLTMGTIVPPDAGDRYAQTDIPDRFYRLRASPEAYKLTGTITGPLEIPPESLPPMPVWRLVHRRAGASAYAMTEGVTQTREIPNDSLPAMAVWRLVPIRTSAEAYAYTSSALEFLVNNAYERMDDLVVSMRRARPEAYAYQGWTPPPDQVGQPFETPRLQHRRGRPDAYEYHTGGLEQLTPPASPAPTDLRIVVRRAAPDAYGYISNALTEAPYQPGLLDAPRLTHRRTIAQAYTYFSNNLEPPAEQNYTRLSTIRILPRRAPARAYDYQSPPQPPYQDPVVMPAWVDRITVRWAASVAYRFDMAALEEGGVRPASLGAFTPDRTDTRLRPSMAAITPYANTTPRDASYRLPPQYLERRIDRRLIQASVYQPPIDEHAEATARPQTPEPPGPPVIIGDLIQGVSGFTNLVYRHRPSVAALIPLTHGREVALDPPKLRITDNPHRHRRTSPTAYEYYGRPLEPFQELTRITAFPDRVPRRFVHAAHTTFGGSPALINPQEPLPGLSAWTNITSTRRPRVVILERFDASALDPVNPALPPQLFYGRQLGSRPVAPIAYDYQTTPVLPPVEQRPTSPDIRQVRHSRATPDAYAYQGFSVTIEEIPQQVRQYLPIALHPIRRAPASAYNYTSIGIIHPDMTAGSMWVDRIPSRALPPSHLAYVSAPLLPVPIEPPRPPETWSVRVERSRTRSTPLTWTAIQPPEPQPALPAQDNPKIVQRRAAAVAYHYHSPLIENVIFRPGSQFSLPIQGHRRAAAVAYAYNNVRPESIDLPLQMREHIPTETLRHRRAAPAAYAYVSVYLTHPDRTAGQAWVDQVRGVRRTGRTAYTYQGFSPTFVVQPPPPSIGLPVDIIVLRRASAEAYIYAGVVPELPLPMGQTVDVIMLAQNEIIDVTMYVNTEYTVTMRVE